MSKRKTSPLYATLVDLARDLGLTLKTRRGVCAVMRDGQVVFQAQAQDLPSVLRYLRSSGAK